MDIVIAQGLIKDYYGLRAVDRVGLAIHQGNVSVFLDQTARANHGDARHFLLMPPTAGTSRFSAWMLPVIRAE